jgi:TolB protein
VGAIAVALLAIAGLAAILVATGRLGQPTKPVARVALVDPDGALAIVDGQGGGRVVHAPAGTAFGFPAWSPDGTRVAAVANAETGAAIRVYSAATDGSASPDGTVVYQSTTSAPFYLYWTPDGRAITFLTQEADSLALRSAPADGSAGATVLREGNPMYWTWEGGDRMLVHTGADTSAFLGRVATDGSTVTTVTGLPGAFRAPAASADGRYEAYVISRADGSSAVVVAASDGSATHEAPIFGPAAFEFAPVAPQLAYIGAGQDDRQAPLPLGPLRIVDAASGEVRQLPVDGVVSFFWSPDGTRIATIGISTPAAPDSALLGAPTAATARLASTRAEGRAATRTADAQGIDVALQFVDVAAGTATPAEVVSLSPLYVNQILPYFDQYALSHRVWSPDGTSILLPVIDAGGNESLEVLPADGSAPRVLAPGSAGFWSP